MAAATQPKNEKATFAAQLSKLTGLDPGVAAAWVVQENAGGGHAHNWLGLRPGVGKTKGYSGVPLTTDSGGFAAFGSESDAVKETAFWINHLPQYAGIRQTKGKTPGSQIAAIASSPWDANHYSTGGTAGAKLLATWRSVTGKPSGSSGGGGIWESVKNHLGDAALVTAGTNPITAPVAVGVAVYDAVTGGGSSIVNAILSPAESAGKSIMGWVMEGLLALVIVVLAAALFYAGVRRLTGDALPSASELRQGSAGAMQTAALAAA
jgi:hypothetical protein